MFWSNALQVAPEGIGTDIGSPFAFTSDPDGEECSSAAKVFRAVTSITRPDAAIQQLRLISATTTAGVGADCENTLTQYLVTSGSAAALPTGSVPCSRPVTSLLGISTTEGAPTHQLSRHVNGNLSPNEGVIFPALVGGVLGLSVAMAALAQGPSLLQRDTGTRLGLLARLGYLSLFPHAQAGVARTYVPFAGPAAVTSALDSAIADNEYHGPTLKRLIQAIDAEPVEDGISHPAESELAQFVRYHGAEDLLRVLFGQSSPNHGRTASLLRLLGRVGGGTAELRARILKTGLASSNVDVRDAAVQAAELWEDRNLAPVLREHEEKLPWLAAYVTRVALDLQG